VAGWCLSSAILISDQSLNPANVVLLRSSAASASCSLLLFASALIIPAARADVVTYELLNGDSISGEFLEDESTDETKVILQPQLGRIEIKVSSIKPPPRKPLWKSNLEAGVNGSSTGDDKSFGASVSATTKYDDSLNELKLSGNYEYDKSRSGSKNVVIGTNQGGLGARYDRYLNERLGAYLSTDYTYNSLNSLGVNNVVSSIGLGYKIVDTDSTVLKLSIGPSLQWFDGGTDCDSKSYCGDVLAASTLGAEFDWKLHDQFTFSIVNRLTAAYVSGISPTNNFNASLKFFPSRNSKFYTALKFQSIYQSLQLPRQDNSYNVQVGTEF